MVSYFWYRIVMWNFPIAMEFEEVLDKTSSYKMNVIDLRKMVLKLITRNRKAKQSGGRMLLVRFFFTLSNLQILWVFFLFLNLSDSVLTFFEKKFLFFFFFFLIF